MQPLSDAANDTFLRTKYVLTDIDDTLTFRGKLAAQTYAALEELQHTGLKVIPVTAASAGWCDLMVRMWPIDAVIGENGGFYNIRHLNDVKRIFWLSDDDRRGAEKFFAELKRQIATEVPTARLSADQSFRLTSIAWERPDDRSLATDILGCLTSSGASATTNSIWIIGWAGGYDKLTMTRRMMSEVYGIDIDRDCDQIVYVGDSINDGPMFNHFPNTVGVSTVVKFLPQLLRPPRWVTRGPGGQGFVEVAKAVISSRLSRARNA
jgi:hydroxymethylpyrimidine pyrophosphatase-like HAD family hydrolase